MKIEIEITPIKAIVYLVIIASIIILIFGNRCSDNNNEKGGTYVINKNEDFKNDKSYLDWRLPDTQVNWKKSKDEPNKIIATDTVKRKVYVIDTIRNVYIDTVDYQFILTNTKANKLLQLDLDDSQLSLTQQDKNSNIFTSKYDINTRDFKYRYVQGEGLSRKRDVFGKQHFDDYLFLDRNWYLNTTSLSNKLQYKTSRIIIEGSIGLEYKHDIGNLDLMITTGIGYKLF